MIVIIAIAHYILMNEPVIDKYMGDSFNSISECEDYNRSEENKNDILDLAKEIQKNTPALEHLSIETICQMDL